MCKVSAFFLFCCLIFVQVSGQDSGKKVTLKKPEKVTVKSKLPSDTCCQSIEQFKTDLSKMDASAFRKKYKNKSAHEIVLALNTIINRVISRENSYRISLLDAVMKEPQPDNVKEKPSYAVRLLISDKNNVSGIPLEGTITFDPATDPIPYLNRIKDSSKNLHADLLAYNNGLLIKFNEQDTKFVHDRQPVPAATSAEPKDPAGFSQTGTLLLLLLGALCGLIGFIAYLRSRSVLLQAKQVRSKSVPPVQQNRAPVAAAPIREKRTPDGYNSYTTNSEKPVTATPEKYQPSAPVSSEQPAIAGLAVAIPVQTSKHFFAEIMTTSGPRKKNMSEPDADKDLGEDVCGFVADDKDLLIYLLDGTSDLHCLRDPENNREYFSSRLLAQSIANQLRLAFTSNRSEAMDVVMMRSIQTVKEDWLRAINSLPEKEKTRVRTSIENKSYPECATTLLIGQLSTTGQLTVYRSGDSKLFMFRNASDNKIRFEDTPLVRKNEESNDRAFFRLVLNAGKEFDILYNKPNYEIIQKQDMRTVVVFSDGIGMLTEQLLQEKYAMNAEAVRKEIIYQTQGTADDKSICFITIRDK